MAIFVCRTKAVMLLYSLSISPRLKYICAFIGRELHGAGFELTTSKEIYQQYAGPKINYTAERIAGDLFWLCPHLLLFEKEIRPQPVECFEANGYKAFFSIAGDFSFDIFAASFYLLSRYEEYLPHTKDIYGRYAHENSLAYKEKFLNVPLINIWMQELKTALKKKFSGFTIHQSPFTFIPTYDIDEAYSYKHKEWWRSAGAAIKDLLKGKWNKFSLRRNVLNNKVCDPFDSYDWIDNLHRPYKLQPRYFFLVPDKTGKYDRNILPMQTAMQALIKRHAVKYAIGVHPSWQSGDEPALIRKEIETIEHITQLKIIASRQHFIRLTLPQTYRFLIEAGIKEDYSLGYGSINGFRASVAAPFFWYDLEKEEETYLQLFPFCYMDANSFYEQKIAPQLALEEMQAYYNAVKAVDGMLITIWHNTFLGTDEQFKGWREVYAKFYSGLTVSV